MVAVAVIALSLLMSCFGTTVQNPSVDRVGNDRGI